MKNRLRLLLKNVFPAIIGQVCFFLFSIVDGIFVSNGVGEDALGGINIALPYIMIINATCILIACGGVAVSSVKSGRGDDEGANKVFMHAFYMMCIIGVVFTVLGTTLSTPIAKLLGANDTFLPYTRDYLLYFSAFAFPMVISNLFQFFGRVDNSPLLVMIAMTVSSLLNIFLDWLFVFPLKLGLMGAAVATGISGFLCWVICLSHFFTKKSHYKFIKVKFDKVLFKKIILRGFPETIAQFSVPAFTMCLNLVLLKHLGEKAVNCYSVINYVASFTVAIFAGISEGVQPLFGKSYGAKNQKDLKFFFKSAVVLNIIGSSIVYVLLLFLGKSVCALYNIDESTTAMTISVIPKFACGFIVMSLSTIISTYLYSTKRTKEAIIMNALRSFFLCIIITILMPIIFGAESVWFSFIVYEMFSVIIGIILIIVSEKNGIVFR